MASEYIMFVKAYAKKHGIKYGDALKKSKEDWKKHKASKGSNKENVSMKVSNVRVGKAKPFKVPNLDLKLEREKSFEKARIDKKAVSSAIQSLTRAGLSADKAKEEIEKRKVRAKLANITGGKLSVEKNKKANQQIQKIKFGDDKATRRRVLKKYTDLKKKVDRGLEDGSLIRKDVDDFIYNAKILAGTSKTNRYAKAISKVQKAFSTKKFQKKSEKAQKRTRPKGAQPIAVPLARDVAYQAQRGKIQATRQAKELRKEQLMRAGATEDEANTIVNEEFRQRQEQSNLERELLISKQRAGFARGDVSNEMLDYNQFVSKLSKQKGVSYNQAATFVSQNNLFRKYQIEHFNKLTAPSTGVGSTSFASPADALAITRGEVPATSKFTKKDGELKKVYKDKLNRVLNEPRLLSTDTNDLEAVLSTNFKLSKAIDQVNELLTMPKVDEQDIEQLENIRQNLENEKARRETGEVQRLVTQQRQSATAQTTRLAQRERAGQKRVQERVEEERFAQRRPATLDELQNIRFGQNRLKKAKEVARELNVENFFWNGFRYDLNRKGKYIKTNFPEPADLTPTPPGTPAPTPPATPPPTPPTISPASSRASTPDPNVPPTGFNPFGVPAGVVQVAGIVIPQDQDYEMIVRDLIGLMKSDVNQEFFLNYLLGQEYINDFQIVFPVDKSTKEDRNKQLKSLIGDFDNAITKKQQTPRVRKQRIDDIINSPYFNQVIAPLYQRLSNRINEEVNVEDKTLFNGFDADGLPIFVQARAGLPQPAPAGPAPAQRDPVLDLPEQDRGKLIINQTIGNLKSAIDAGADDNELEQLVNVLGIMFQEEGVRIPEDDGSGGVNLKILKFVDNPKLQEHLGEQFDPDLLSTVQRFRAQPPPAGSGLVGGGLKDKASALSLAAQKVQMKHKQLIASLQKGKELSAKTLAKVGEKIGISGKQSVKTQTKIDDVDRKYFEASADVYQKEDSRPSHIGKYLYNEPASNFEHAIYVDENAKKLIIAFRGSVSGEDWLVSDRKILFSRLTTSERFKREKKWTSEVLSMLPNYQVEFTGHSLGGALAIEMANTFRKPAVVFNAGASLLGERLKTREDDIKFYTIKGDLVSANGVGRFKDTRILDSQAGNSGSAHTLTAFRGKDEGGLGRENTAYQAVALKGESNDPDESSQTQQPPSAPQGDAPDAPDETSADNQAIDSQVPNDAGVAQPELAPDDVAKQDDESGSLSARDLGTETGEFGGAFTNLVNEKTNQLVKDINSLNVSHSPKSIREAVAKMKHLRQYGKYHADYNKIYRDIHRRVKELNNHSNRLSDVNVKSIVKSHIGQMLNHLDYRHKSIHPLFKKTMEDKFSGRLNHDNRMLTDRVIKGNDSLKDHIAKKYLHERSVGHHLSNQEDKEPLEVEGGGLEDVYRKYIKQGLLGRPTSYDFSTEKGRREFEYDTKDDFMSRGFKKLGKSLLNKIKKKMAGRGGALTLPEHNLIKTHLGNHLNVLQRNPDFVARINSTILP